MVTLNEFSDLVVGIHSCATDPEAWGRVLGQIGSTLGSCAAIVEIADTHRVLTHTLLPEDAAGRYAAYYERHDHVMAAVQQGPVGVVRTGPELMWPNEKCEFSSDWALPNGFEDGLFVRLTKEGSAPTLALSTKRRSDRFDTSENVALVASLSTHFRQSLRTRGALQEAAIESSLGNAPSIRHGLIVVTADGHIRHATAYAENILRAGDGLRVTRSGAVQASFTQDDAILQHAIWCATSAPVHIGRSLRCGRSDDRQPFIVHVAPIGIGEAVLTVVNPDLPHVPEAALLIDLFGLTPAEAQISQMIVDCQGLRAVADQLSVSIATVKTHLLSTFRKTGVCRQSDLVHLLVTLDPMGTASTVAQG